MKAGIKRIEATLHDLDNRDDSENSSTKQPPFSFRISVGTQESKEATLSTTESEHQETEEDLLHHVSVQTFPASEGEGKTPTLPKFKNPNFTSHRNGANPALAMNLLQEIQVDVAKWHTELQKIVRRIQDIYLEGPIVNGWLESHEREPEEKGTATLRHGEVDRLMDYVEEICSSQEKEPVSAPRTGYRLCALDSAGKVWTRSCPPEQVASVSMAIARYQKLRQLLGRKQYLETKLGQLAETLVVLHSHIQSP
jgi:hypothetical protein